MSKPPEDENVRVKDYFGTFLQSVKRSSPDYPDEPPATSSAAGMPAAQGTVGGLSVLTVLASSEEPIGLATLMTRLGVGVLQVASVLSPLVESGLIEVTGVPGDERVGLTQDGTRLTRTAS